MSVTNWRTAGTVASVLYDPNSSGGLTVWTDPTNAQGSADGSYATQSHARIESLGQDYSLYASNFGFSTSDLPSGVNIKGIEFVVTRKNVMSVGTLHVIDIFTYMVLAAGTFGDGANKADFTAWATSDEFKFYGGATDKFGQLPTTTDIFHSNFGLIYCGDKTLTGSTFGSSCVAHVDSFEARIHFGDSVINKATNALQVM